MGKQEEQPKADAADAPAKLLIDNANALVEHAAKQLRITKDKTRERTNQQSEWTYLVSLIIEQLATGIANEADDQMQQLIDRLAPKGIPRPAITMWGFLRNPSPDDKNTYRLYLNLEFTAYVDFSINSYIHHVNLASAFNPLGGTIVWIDRDARVQYTRQQSTPIEAQFTQGDIARTFMMQPGMPGIPVMPNATGAIGNVQVVSGGGCSPSSASCPAGQSGGGCSPSPALCGG